MSESSCSASAAGNAEPVVLDPAPRVRALGRSSASEGARRLRAFVVVDAEPRVERLLAGAPSPASASTAARKPSPRRRRRPSS